MQEVDFFKLSRAVQDRFLASLRGVGEPSLLLWRSAESARELFPWALSMVALVGALWGAMRWDYGDLHGALSRQPVAMVALYAVLLAGVFFCLLKMAVAVRAQRALPFRAGTYVLPSGVIDAKSGRLRCFSFAAPGLGEGNLRGAAEVAREGASLRIVFAEGATFRFDLGPGDAGDRTVVAVTKARDAMVAARASADSKALARLDPTQDIGVANPFASVFPIKNDTPVWVRFWKPGSVAIGVALSPLLWYGRNAASDASMLARARSQNDVESFHAYLARGGTDPQVGDVWLPRAELVVAVRRGSLAALEAYAVAHPGSHISGEVSAALKQAMLRELEQTKRQGTVSSLTAFAKDHPHHLVDVEIQQAIHAVYQGALARYKQESGIADPQVIAFISRLLASAEQGGPVVEVRFRRKPTKSMDIADAQVKKSPFFMGPASGPSQYFDDAHARAREASAAKALIERFSAAFPADILTFEQGAPLSSTEGPLPAVRRPTLFVEHSSEGSGASYLSANPRGVFVGLGLLFEATFRLPDDGKPHRFRLSAWRPPDTTVPRGDRSFEAAVYEAMAAEGFAQFAKKYLVNFFPRSEAKLAN